MVDAGTGLAILGSAIGSAKLAEKVLGPTADYFGAGLKDFTEKRWENIRNIFKTAESKITEDQISSGVSPRVLRDVINDGSFREDSVSSLYYGGVLASSKTGISRDDRGAYHSALISRLSSYQLRGHYILYRSLYNVYKGDAISLYNDSGRRACRVVIPIDDYLASMKVENGENMDVLFSHVLFGLQRENLIDVDWSSGSWAVLGISSKINKDDGGVVFLPSALGAELFLWATGNSKISIGDFFTSAIDIDLDEIPLCAGAFRFPK